MAIINNNMHHGIMEALEIKVRDITIGNMKDVKKKIHGSQI